MNSLLGHIVLNHTSQAENLATESLNYIISNSSTAKKALIKRLKNVENNLNNELLFRTQVYDEDRAFPDLVGFDDDNDQVCIIESKFWAGLTDNQPVTYIKRFNPSKYSLVLFLAPAKRIDSLWSELMQRCKDKEMEVISENKDEKLIYGNLNDKHSICIIDWNSLLNTIENELEAAGDYYTKSDIIQLKGLCSQMDDEAFIPLNSQDLSPIGKRNIHFVDLVENVVNRGIARGKFTKNGQGVSNTKYWYGRYFVLNGHYYCLSFDNANWSELRNTPLWLEVYGKMYWGYSKIEKDQGLTVKDGGMERKRVQKALFKLELESPSRLVIYDDGTSSIPIKLELGVGEDQIIESILEQIEEIGSLLAEHYEK